MIQRIQSVYLLLVAGVAAGLPFLFSLYQEAGAPVYATDRPMVLAGFIGSATIALIAIFQFKNRQLQVVLNRLNIIVNLILLGVFVYRSLTMSGEEVSSEKGIGMLIPIVSIVLLFLATRAIRKDEQLVKSADRLR
jgi:hypothetical protein